MFNRQVPYKIFKLVEMKEWWCVCNKPWARCYNSVEYFLYAALLFAENSNSSFIFVNSILCGMRFHQHWRLDFILFLLIQWLSIFRINQIQQKLLGKYSNPVRYCTLLQKHFNSISYQMVFLPFTSSSSYFIRYLNTMW